MCSLQSLSDLSLTHINVYALIFLIDESMSFIDVCICLLQINYLSLAHTKLFIAHTEFRIIYMPYTASFGVCL